MAGAGSNLASAQSEKKDWIDADADTISRISCRFYSSNSFKRNLKSAQLQYVDFDNYSERLAGIGRTNAMLRAIRLIVAGVPNKMRIVEPICSQMIAEVERWHKSGYVDWISLSSNLLFAMNYVNSFEEFAKATLYNRLRQWDYSAEGYLDGVETVAMDYRKLSENAEIYRHQMRGNALNYEDVMLVKTAKRLFKGD